VSPLILAATPALPLNEAGKYVAGAYVVFLALIVIYVAIMASKLQRMERDLRELAELAEHRAGGDQAVPESGSAGQPMSGSLALSGAEEGAPDE
jgi:hypothetical protein